MEQQPQIISCLNNLQIAPLPVNYAVYYVMFIVLYNLMLMRSVASEIAGFLRELARKAPELAKFDKSRRAAGMLNSLRCKVKACAWEGRGLHL